MRILSFGRSVWMSEGIEFLSSIRLPGRFVERCRALANASPILALKLPHKLHQRFAARARKGVVNRSANATDRTMAFQAVHAGRRRFVRELLFQILRRQPK